MASRTTPVLSSPIAPGQSSPVQNLYDAVGWVQSVLKKHISSETNKEEPDSEPPPCPNLARLGQRLGLSSFEEKVVLFCAAVEIEPECASLCAQVAQNPQHTYPSLVLALSLFSDATWDILAIHRPLLHWQLIQIADHPSPMQARASIDPRILAYLLGVRTLDAQLKPWIQPLLTQIVSLSPSHDTIAQQVVDTWRAGNMSLTQLCSTDETAKLAIAHTIANTLSLKIYRLSASTLPTNVHDLAALKQRWLREAILSQAILLIDCGDYRPSGPVNMLSLWLEDLEIPIILSTEQRLAFKKRTCLTYNIPRLHHGEKRQLWENYLGDRTTELNGQLEPLIAQFNLNGHTIQAACESAQQTAPENLAEHLWTYCRTQARPNLEHLAQRMNCIATWDDLILPEREKTILKNIAAHVKNRAKVYAAWGFSGKSSRGLGISALFAGPSGTGKTMAAEVLAREFNLDLYRIDLSAVSSKYIGETEKNLRQIFDAAESGGAVLLFDEADALFGKRTEVSSSHDRHANLEVSYLLQRMEAYQGLAILTTNLKDSLDQAFIRRLRFIINFPYPKKEARSEIWSHIFPKKTPTHGLNYKLLGQLDMAGGNIRSVALNAAFIAAEADEPVMMKHILTAAQAECVKIGRALSPTEVASWLK